MENLFFYRNPRRTTIKMTFLRLFFMPEGGSGLQPDSLTWDAENMCFPSDVTTWRQKHADVLEDDVTAWRSVTLIPNDGRLSPRRRKTTNAEEAEPFPEICPRRRTWSVQQMLDKKNKSQTFLWFLKNICGRVHTTNSKVVEQSNAADFVLF